MYVNELRHSYHFLFLKSEDNVIDELHLAKLAIPSVNKVKRSICYRKLIIQGERTTGQQGGLPSVSLGPAARTNKTNLILPFTPFGLYDFCIETVLMGFYWALDGYVYDLFDAEEGLCSGSFWSDRDLFALNSVM